MLTVFAQCLRNDLKTLIRQPAQWLHPIAFFGLIVCLFGIGLGSDNTQLIQLSPVIIWVAFLLTAIFTIETLFYRDYEEGVLEQWMVSPYPLWWLMLAKSLAFWLASCLPLIVMMPVLGFSLQLTGTQCLLLLISLLLGSPALTFLGVIGATLTLTVARSGVFLALLLLPLFVPILILGVSVVISLLAHEWPVFQMALLGGISVLTMTFAPFAAAAALKVAIH